MALNWEFPDILVNSIREHHASSKPLAAAALVASLDDTERPPTDQLFQFASEHHQLGVDVVEALLVESFGEAKEIARMFV